MERICNSRFFGPCSICLGDIVDKVQGTKILPAGDNMTY